MCSSPTCLFLFHMAVSVCVGRLNNYISLCFVSMLRVKCSLFSKTFQPQKFSCFLKYYRYSAHNVICLNDELIFLTKCEVCCDFCNCPFDASAVTNETINAFVLLHTLQIMLHLIFLWKLWQQSLKTVLFFFVQNFSHICLTSSCTCHYVEQLQSVNIAQCWCRLIRWLIIKVSFK